MKRNTVLAGALVAAGLLVGAPASASIMIATYQGTVVAGQDAAGVFGKPGGDLAGLTYVQAFTYDTTLGSRFTSVTSDEVNGGAAVGTTSPIIDAWLIINGVTHHQAVGHFGDAATSQDTSRLQEVNDGFWGSFEERSFAGVNVSPAPPVSLDTTFVRSLSFSGCGVYLNCGNAFAAIDVDDPSTYAYYLAFNPTSVSVSPLVAGGVPEPATWALMILGFGLVGGMLRARRKAARGHHAAG